jgi:hypothetical protein
MVQSNGMKREIRVKAVSSWEAQRMVSDNLGYDDKITSISDFWYLR